VPDRHDLRRWANAANLSTALGLGLAALGGGRVRPWRRGIVVATGTELPFPRVPAFTVGNVVLVRCPHEDFARWEASRPGLMDHEERHATQYAWCLGPVMLPLYLAACGWSWLRCGDWWSANTFERRAGLAAGGYRQAPPRAVLRRSA